MTDERDLPRPKTRFTNRHLVTAVSCVVLLPNMAFAAHLQLFPASVMLAGGLGYILLMLRAQQPSLGSILERPLHLPYLCASLALAFLLLVLGGEGHLFFANKDWLWRDAVLSDLVQAPFPPAYEVGGERFFLRAPLGMYMVPALIGKVTSLSRGHAVLVVQNTIFLGSVLYTLAAIAKGRAVLTVAVFLTFSGLDVVGEVVMLIGQGRSLSSFVMPSHIESWMELQYSSMVTQIFWVPNHALPSYWLALLALLCVKREIAIGELGLVLAASLFWSPFAFIGTLPLILYLVVRDARLENALATGNFWLSTAASLCFLPVAAYLQLDAAQVPHEFLLLKPFMALFIIVFLVIELPHLAIIRLAWHRLDPELKGLLVVSVVILVVLPTMRLGLSNDLVMRASIPALMIVAFAFAQALSVSWIGFPKTYAAGLLLILVGAVTPAQEVIRSLTFARFAISDCNLATVWKKIGIRQPALENYFAHRSVSPGWLMREPKGEPLIDQPESVCWSDIPYDPRANISVLSNQMLLDSGGTPNPPL